MKRYYAVEIKREGRPRNGTIDAGSFLARAGRGIAPSVFAKRKDAVAYQNDLRENKFECRVVEVEYREPIIMDEVRLWRRATR